MKKVLIPIPNYGFDPTEAAIPWKILSESNIQIIFATPNGKKSAGDEIMLTGRGLGIWKPLLRARKDAVNAYLKMEKSKAFNKPISYSDIRENDYDGIYLPGGHDKGVKEYLESKILQKIVVDFFDSQKKIAAVCHGVLLLARSINPKNNKSVLYDYKTTSLLKSQELSAYNLTKLWLKDYYLTYPGTTVEEEVKMVLRNENQFITGAKPKFRDKEDNLKYGFSVRDRNYISARWPGDIYNLTFSYIDMLNETDDNSKK